MICGLYHPYITHISSKYHPYITHTYHPNITHISSNTHISSKWKEKEKSNWEMKIFYINGGGGKGLPRFSCITRLWIHYRKGVGRQEGCDIYQSTQNLSCFSGLFGSKVVHVSSSQILIYRVVTHKG